MQSVEPKINKDVYNFISPLNSINQKNRMVEHLLNKLRMH